MPLRVEVIVELTALVEVVEGAAVVEVADDGTDDKVPEFDFATDETTVTAVVALTATLNAEEDPPLTGVYPAERLFGDASVDASIFEVVLVVEADTEAAVEVVDPCGCLAVVLVAPSKVEFARATVTPAPLEVLLTAGTDGAAGVGEAEDALNSNVGATLCANPTSARGHLTAPAAVPTLSGAVQPRNGI
ncbi:hypothetical protein SAMN02745225_00308 [Ferrithrix thermotolerans DSM 19514]|uniref:Uncharacterized protein n=1 Tax=Ferrithrix thermotolerans DSM 19514 TaxID=1121881 RepID=A0A1M4SNE7_9ACTN|nr:hypothetical protein [Ferrithrix thermotolerans]SHE33750.1 hypothetical protein SAMN02745225_00308 [Ferrithrix thermotolerans DSM 19514]